MDSSATKLQRAKRLVPAPLKRAVKTARSQWLLRRAVRTIAGLPLGMAPTRQMLLDLQAGWTNEGYAARTDYLEAVARTAATTRNPILECGSGLTTILCGLLAGRRGVSTYSLEHTPEWRERINAALEQFKIPRVQVAFAPLRAYDGFTWYDAPLAALPQEFGLVICDGPPGTTPGGRYGLVPVAGDRLLPGTIVLLDDTERPSEIEVLSRWARETPISIAAHETPSGSFAVVTRQAAVVPSGSRLGQQSVKSSPAVSVIIPAYNVAAYIKETLDSVFAQTFTNFEVILVNDGSLDTGELETALEPYADRLSYIKQENGGASVARNAGLRAARGELIAFLDADDLWLPNYLNQQLHFLKEQDCDLVCADAMVFGDSPDAGQSYMTSVMGNAAPAGTVSFLDLVSAEISLITSGVIVRRSLIFEVGLFDVALRNAQDFDLWLRLARHGARLAYQRRVLLRYRSRLNSLTGDATNSLNRELRVLEKVERSYDLTPEESREALPVIRKRQRILQFELGKLLMARGDIALARAAFSKANNRKWNWKAQATLWLSYLAPRALKALCRRRLKLTTAKRPVRGEVVEA